MKRIVLLCVSCLLSVAFRSQAEFAMPDLEKVPTDRLIANLTQKAKDNSKDVQTWYALARLHAMVFAKSPPSFEAKRKDGLPFFGFHDQGFLPREKATTTND